MQGRLCPFQQGIILPLTPMVGVIGVAPQRRRSLCRTRRSWFAYGHESHHGRFQKSLLPVAQVKGLAGRRRLACMGDGELSGTGIETAGKV